jgi:hypothetical protein
MISARRLNALKRSGHYIHSVVAYHLIDSIPGLNNLHGPARASLAVDHLPALFGSHADSEADGFCSFNLADLVWIVHR